MPYIENYSRDHISSYIIRTREDYYNLSRFGLRDYTIVLKS